jgi:hypothetical protein
MRDASVSELDHKYNPHLTSLSLERIGRNCTGFHDDSASSAGPIRVSTDVVRLDNPGLFLSSEHIRSMI